MIGIYIERSLEMVTGILGILKSGGAYVPFDSADPEERLKFKINNCGCKLVLSTSDRLEDLVFLAETDTIPMCLDSYADEIDRAPVSNPSWSTSQQTWHTSSTPRALPAGPRA